MTSPLPLATVVTGAPLAVTPARRSATESIPTAEYLELCRLADRAELWATIAPGLGHHLANALMSLAMPGDHPVVRGSAQTRIERAHRVLTGMCDLDSAAVPAALASVFDDVEAWHRLQLELPHCELRREIELAPAVPGDSRLHHALLAIVTLAKEAGATWLVLRGRPTERGTAIEIEAPASAGVARSGARRLAVVEHLLATMGGSLRTELGSSGRRWSLWLPRILAAR